MNLVTRFPYVVHWLAIEPRDARPNRYHRDLHDAGEREQDAGQHDSRSESCHPGERKHYARGSEGI